MLRSSIIKDWKFNFKAQVSNISFDMNTIKKSNYT